jgi:predicted NBD/HSP70 family sugar kinase
MPQGNEGLTGKRASAFRAAQVVLARTVTTRRVVSEICGTESAGNERVNDLRLADIVMAPKKFGKSDALQLAPGLGFTVGVDIAHDGLAVTAADAACTPLLATPVDRRLPDREVERNPTGVLSQIAEIVMEVIDQTRRPLTDLIGIGVGIPAPVHRPTGVISSATHVLSGWWDLKPAEELMTLLSGQREFKQAGIEPNVAIENDGTLGALGIFIKEALNVSKLEHVIEDLVYIRFGSGIGGGIIAEGRPVRGCTGFAGEIGHIKVDAHGPLCPRCGQRGCMETKAAAGFLTSQVSGRGIVEFEKGMSSARKMAQMVQSPHPACRRAFADAGYYVGLALAHACILLDPQHVYAAGEMTRSQHFMNAMETSLQQNATTTVGRHADAVARGFVQTIDPRMFFPGGLDPELLGALVLPLHKFGDRHIRQRVIERISPGHSEHAFAKVD